MEKLLNRKVAKGFTLLEILVAATVLGIISVVIFAIFQTALKSRDLANREMKMLRDARFAMDQIEKDVTNIFFRDETSYNISIQAMIEQMTRDRMTAEQSQDWEAFYNKWGYPEGEGDEDHTPSIGNPYDKGRMIDLQFFGDNGGEKDSLSMAIYDRLDLGGPYRAWGVSRVSYTVEKGWLLRISESVETEERNQLGESLGKEDIPIFTRLAEGVEEFDLQYAFWFDNTWYEAKSWDSTGRNMRNARVIMAEHDELQEDYEDRLRQAEEGILRELKPGDPGWNQYVNDLDTEPLNRLPAYIRVKLVTHDPENEGRKKTLERLIRVPGSLETWVPAKILEDEEARELEVFARDDKYKRVYPAALDMY